MESLAIALNAIRGAHKARVKKLLFLGGSAEIGMTCLLR
jgi:hypothetical protein